MLRILLTEFLRELNAQRRRAFLTTFAVTWGTISIVLLLAFGEGLRHTAVEGLLNAGERIFKIYGGTTAMEFEGLERGRRVRLRVEDLELLRRSIPRIDAGSPSYGRSVTLEAGDVRTTTYMEGVWPAFAELRRMDPRAGGRFLNRRDLEERRRVLFLGDEIAARLFGDEEPFGRTVEVDGLPFTVVGVMRKKFQDSMSNGPDAERAIVPASTFRTVYGTTHVNHLLVRPRSVAEAGAVKAEIFRVLGRRHRFHPEDERALPMWDFIEDERITRGIGVGIQIFMGMVGVLTLLVAGVGVANIMIVLVRERTREIGLKLAVGARRRHVMGQFVLEALLLTLGGGLLGLLVAVGVVIGVDAVPHGEDAMRYILDPRLSWTVVGTAVSILMAVGLTAGILPARRAARLDPVEALRHE